MTTEGIKRGLLSNISKVGKFQGAMPTSTQGQMKFYLGFLLGEPAKIVSSIFYSVTSSIQTNQKCKEVRDRSAEDEKVKNEVIISFESAD